METISKKTSYQVKTDMKEEHGNIGIKVDFTYDFVDNGLKDLRNETDNEVRYWELLGQYKVTSVNYTISQSRRSQIGHQLKLVQFGYSSLPAKALEWPNL